ncbi:cytidine deaminase [Cochleicola gelatinilyticus]|uniref:Cytidine deaminase n=1 Tax=Cochleicola gelatinilyticus TaxID=1763537 RepID=A0A167IHC8_9FLAO|nr:cytidine deaminase [Cochleicola gelatinilyticus]OAB79652.1 cytidine deaminase [Cochleicola gelatinilyticus]
MKKLTIETHLEVFETFSELPLEVQNLMNKAQQARENAYAPYSHFKVGAALQLASGETVIGNNQENAAFPSGLCAERVAVFYAGASYPSAIIKMMAITARSLKQKVTTPIPPCGACRQSLVEYEVKQNAPIILYFMGESGKIVKANSIKDLLPLIFDSSYL